MQGGVHTGRCFVVVPCQERAIVKSTRLCFLSEGAVYSCFVCNLRPLSPVPPTVGILPLICLTALVFFQIVAYFHTVGTIVATLECLLSELD